MCENRTNRAIVWLGALGMLASVAGCSDSVSVSGESGELYARYRDPEQREDGVHEERRTRRLHVLAPGGELSLRVQREERFGLPRAVQVASAAAVDERVVSVMHDKERIYVRGVRVGSSLLEIEADDEERSEQVEDRWAVRVAEPERFGLLYDDTHACDPRRDAPAAVLVGSRMRFEVRPRMKDGAPVVIDSALRYFRLEAAPGVSTGVLDGGDPWAPLEVRYEAPATPGLVRIVSQPDGHAQTLQIVDLSSVDRFSANVLVNALQVGASTPLAYRLFSGEQSVCARTSGRLTSVTNETPGVCDLSDYPNVRGVAPGTCTLRIALPGAGRGGQGLERTLSFEVR